MVRLPGVVTGWHQMTWHRWSGWQMAEELGFDSVWLFDHFMTPLRRPGRTMSGNVDATVGTLAVKTSRVKIGVLVYGNTHRHPAILAKEIVTVDHVSMGRAILGIGAGWNAREHAAYSIPFPSPGDRVEMLDESLPDHAVAVYRATDNISGPALPAR